MSELFPCQPIETAPIDETILVWGPHEDCDDEIERWYPAFRTDFQPTLWWIAGSIEQVVDPTHWQPMPTPPHNNQEEADRG